MAVARAIRPGSGAFVALIASLMTVTAMTIDINLPAIPIMAEVLGASLTTAQLTVTIFFLGFAFGQLFWGPLSDATGRKPAMLAGLALYEAATIGCAFAGDMSWLLGLRLVQGFGAGAGSVLARAVIRDLFQGQQMARILSLALAAFITAPIIAPSIGALILTVASWRWIFGFLAIYGALLLLLAGLFLEESLKTRHPEALNLKRLSRALAEVFRHPASRSWAVAVTLAFGTLTVWLANSPAVLMEAYGMQPQAFGIAFAVIAAASAVGNLANSRLVRHVPLGRVVTHALTAGSLAIALTLGLALAGAGSWLIVAGMSLFFAAFGLIVANATTLALQPHGMIVGSAAAALGFVHTIVPAALGSLVAVLYDGSAVPMLGAILLLLIGGRLAVLRTPAIR